MITVVFAFLIDALSAVPYVCFYKSKRKKKWRQRNGNTCQGCKIVWADMGQIQWDAEFHFDEGAAVALQGLPRQLSWNARMEGATLICRTGAGGRQQRPCVKSNRDIGGESNVPTTESSLPVGTAPHEFLEIIGFQCVIKWRVDFRPKKGR